MDVERAAEQLTERKVVRHGLLAGLGGLGAAALMKLNGAGRAEATNGQPILAAVANTATTLTKLSISSDNDCAFLAINGTDISIGAARFGVVGVAGINSSTATMAVGVQGFSFNTGANAIGVLGTANSGIGVRGISNSTTGIGVRGANGSNGTGIKGLSNTGGGREYGWHR